MTENNGTGEAYRKLTSVLKRASRGVTVADAVAKSALPLETVRELLPRAADEFSGRLQVTASGEILYSFPHGFTSRYRGFRARAERALYALGTGLKAAGALLFKVWIMVMLVGYFALFMLLALGTLMLSVAGGSGRDRRRGGGAFFVSGIFDTIIRIWFYSELLKPAGRRYAESRKRPLHRAIFSFVFGDGDPNVRGEEQEKKAVIAFIQARRGVISMPEFAAITGYSFQEAEERITAYCVEFGGSPEVTGEGTIVYRFDELLRRADTKDRSFGGALSGPLKRPALFSSNEKKLNVWFSVINAANLLFGGYFFSSALRFGEIVTQKQFDAASYFYGVVYVMSAQLLRDPLGVITIALGLVPIVFSVLFWLIPGLRFLRLKKDNEQITFENFRKESYVRIWDSPGGVDPAEFSPAAAECRPKNLPAAQDQVIKEAGVVWTPEITVDGNGKTRYTFADLEREKRALEAYRSTVDLAAAAPGRIIFDSEGGEPV
ncbi:MAG: hypothetical protein LBC88_06100 [Spirochaetaceae bacterium]|jgi:hypothetical protein|nr:hypothetical protein [Spirochaetaceae bacterium]